MSGVADSVATASVAVDQHARWALKGQRPAVIWMTGLSGAGKSTIARLIERHLHDEGRHACVLDGDHVRQGLCSDLGFSDADRSENIRRAAQVARLMTEAGLIVIVAFISPFGADRQRARALFAPGEFIEVYVHLSREAAEARDPKGLYRKARAGQIPRFTGIDSTYEAPLRPDIVIDSCVEPADAAARRVVTFLRKQIRWP